MTVCNGADRRPAGQGRAGQRCRSIGSMVQWAIVLDDLPLYTFVKRQMYKCPACNALTISYFRKWCSRPAAPAYCSACRGYSHAKQSSGGVGLVIAVLVITASGFIASALLAVWPLLSGIGAAILFFIWHWHRTELEMLSPDLVSRARKTETMTNIALLLLLFLN